MSREIRKVPANWQHPLDESGMYVPVALDAMPKWGKDVASHFMAYETTSEGTPLTPALSTKSKLCEYLADNQECVWGATQLTAGQWSVYLSEAQCSLKLLNFGRAALRLEPGSGINDSEGREVVIHSYEYRDSRKDFMHFGIREDGSECTITSAQLEDFDTFFVLDDVNNIRSGIMERFGMDHIYDTWVGDRETFIGVISNINDSCKSVLSALEEIGPEYRALYDLGLSLDNTCKSFTGMQLTALNPKLIMKTRKIFGDLDLVNHEDPIVSGSAGSAVACAEQGCIHFFDYDSIEVQSFVSDEDSCFNRRLGGLSQEIARDMSEGDPFTSDDIEID